MIERQCDIIPLPCPFCGSPARSENGFAPLESICYVWCKNEDCFMSVGSIDERVPDIREWNTRTTEI